MNLSKNPLIWVFYFELKLFIVYYKHMKPEFNKTWLWIAIIIVGNIVIFFFLSKKLEIYVENNMARQTAMEIK
jgi:hypothetical protein